jgi:hypothetical protein
MRINVVLVLHLCSLVGSLTLQHHDHSCTDSLLKEAHSAVQSKSWDVLRNNPCVAHNLEEVDALEQGFEDPDDVVEWLPKVQTDERNFERSGSTSGLKKQIPSVLFIGFGHSGSTALAEQLDMHPELSYGDVKEHRFHVHGNPKADKAAYLNEFTVDSHVKHTFDATIGYCARREDFIKPFMKIVGPDTKILVMFRDPTKFLNSILSNYGLHSMIGKIRKGNSCYAEELARWAAFVPMKNWHFIRSEDYFVDNQKVMDGVLDWIGVRPKNYTKSQVSKAKHSGRRRSPPNKMSDTQYRQYVNDPKHFECAKRLEQMTGLTLPWPWYMERLNSSSHGGPL